jgi:hypothetical protein
MQEDIRQDAAVAASALIVNTIESSPEASQAELFGCITLIVREAIQEAERRLAEAGRLLRWRCPSCFKLYRIAPEKAGKCGKCKRCGFRQIVPEKVSRN